MKYSTIYWSVRTRDLINLLNFTKVEGMTRVALHRVNPTPEILQEIRDYSAVISEINSELTLRRVV